MRILYVNSVYPKGSTGTIVHILNNEGQKRGDETEVCYGRGIKISDRNAYKFSFDIETLLHCAMTRVTGFTGSWSLLSTIMLLKRIQEFHPDVVHLHEMHAYFVNPGMIFRYLTAKGIPVVYTFHCEFPYTGKCGIAGNCVRWKDHCGKCPDVHKYPKSLFFDFTSFMLRRKKSDWDRLRNVIIAVPSEWMAERVRASFLRERDIRVIWNAVNTVDVFYPHDPKALRKKHHVEGRKVVLSVAPRLMSALKGGKWVLSLAEEMKNDNILFILVGADGYDGPRPANAIVLGSIQDRYEMADYYSMADCFVLCSELETFSLTCAESICCGTPVVGFRCGAPETVFRPPVAAFIPYGNIEMMADEVRKMLYQKPEKKFFDEYRLLLSKERMFREYRKIYEELVQTKNSRRSECD